MHDHQLIAECLADRDRLDVWREFECRYRPRLIAGIRRGLCYAWERPQPELLEELLQDCYCRLLEHDSRALRCCLEMEQPRIGAYLVQVGRSVALDWLRRRGADKRGHDLTLVVDRHWLAEIGDETSDAEQLFCAREMLKSFWADCRDIVAATGNPARLEILRQVWLQQRPSREIAAETDLAVSSVDSVVCRMRRRLAERGWTVADRGRGIGSGE